MKVVSERKICSMVQCSLFAALLCICSPLAVPFGVIPITLGLFAVILTGIVLGVKKAVLSIVLYMIIGICGLPVFSGARAGIGVLFGPTGGYLWSYIFVAMLAAFSSGLKIRKEAVKITLMFILCMLGVGVCYFCGTVQYMLVTECEIKTALVTCVYGFVIFDVIKTLLAVIVGVRLKKALKNASMNL